jgi:hypothetical protein
MTGLVVVMIVVSVRAVLDDEAPEPWNVRYRSLKLYRAVTKTPISTSA